MLRLSHRLVAFLSVMLAVCVALPAAAQGRRRGGARPESAKPDATAAAAQGADSLNNLKFRNLGPAVGGGRVTAVAGIPGDPNTYYAGAAAGGVWKTTDGGNSWDAIFADQPTASVGAVALAPSNPNLVWVGSGEANLRNDLVDGRGVFFSPDAGKTWQFKGLGDVGQISRTKDGGLTWDKLKEGLPPGLIGRIALAAGPTNPSHVYALIESKQGVLWDSKDQGDHWAKASDFHGLSARPFYFSLMHVSPVDDRKVVFSSYLLLRSDDGGKTTTPIDRGVHVDHHALWIDPQNPDRMIQGNDGGVDVTQNGAKSWRLLDNRPIGLLDIGAAVNDTPHMLSV